MTHQIKLPYYHSILALLTQTQAIYFLWIDYTPTFYKMMVMTVMRYLGYPKMLQAIFSCFSDSDDDLKSFTMQWAR